MMTTRNQELLALMPLGFVRHSRANGNPGSIPSLDSRFRRSDEFSLSLKGAVSGIPAGDTKPDHIGSRRLK